MKRIALQTAAGLLAACAAALDAGEMPDERAAALLERKCIETDAAGLLPARFDEVTAYLNRPDLLERVQAAYRRAVSKAGTLHYPVVRNGPVSYYTISEKNRRTDLTVLYQGFTSGGMYELAYHACGKRFFGRYEVLIRIRIFDAAPAGTAYTVSVHAYPHNASFRFLARRLGSAERYFRRRTAMITRVSERICRDLEPPFSCMITCSDPALLRAE